MHIGTADANVGSSGFALCLALQISIAVSCGLLEVPLALERCSSADSGNPEADLARHIEPRTANHSKPSCITGDAKGGFCVPEVARAVKDTELLRNTLRSTRSIFDTGPRRSISVGNWTCPVASTRGNLAFFETFDDDSLHCLIEDRMDLQEHVNTWLPGFVQPRQHCEAMEVYEFQPGEKVVRQGDTDGAPKPRKKRSAVHPVVGAGVNSGSMDSEQ